MEILSHPSPALKLVAQPVDPATEADLRQLVERMARAMYEAPGIGLAATQVGVMKRVIVYDLDDELVALCNPVITWHSEQTEVFDEGCLSLLGLEIPIERPVAVTCEALDLRGNPVRIEADELLARLLQHEIDHLDGIIILDRATPEERKSAIKRYMELTQAHSR
ncbi:MAG: peptide deformylase [Actinobacteria bacterium]|nr:peptide deformylase [Actinomycetota bacterium]